MRKLTEIVPADIADAFTAMVAAYGVTEEATFFTLKNFLTDAQILYIHDNLDCSVVVLYGRWAEEWQEAH